jgi:hypothetical protein
MPNAPTHKGRGEIGLGDLTRALHELGTRDPASVSRIARCLGFCGMDSNPPEAMHGAYEQRLRRPFAREAAAEPLSGFQLPPLQPPQPDLPREILETDWEALAPLETDPPPSWLEDMAPLPQEALAAPPRRAPLFTRLTTPGILGAAVATRRPGVDLDMERLVEGLVRGEVPRRLPFKPCPSLNQGIQLLLDASEYMTPFYPDLQDLQEGFRQLMGGHRCEVFEFAGDPAGAATWSLAGTRRSWRPQSGRPIVLATNLGIGAPAASGDYAGPRAWRAFARTACRAGCPVVVFLPLTPARWPIALARRFTLIHWDPRTRAAAVRRLVGPGHETGP